MSELTDEAFFAQYPERQTRIRLPGRQLYRDKQRAVRYMDEEELSFARLGPHDVRRRRILLYRVPRNNPGYDPEHPQIIKIPFLAFADETIENEDAVLLPIVHEIMLNQAAKG